jgi:NAD+-dependent protein deacetylase sirtuin 4
MESTRPDHTRVPGHPVPSAGAPHAGAPGAPSAPAAFPALVRLLRERRVVVLSGAGCSTESGIPDYRGPGRRNRSRTPMLYQEFVRDPEARVRYWSRSAVGWPRFARARPNEAHRALARLEEAGLVRGVITQNVDGLHQAAGSRAVVELHGALARVRCLDCGTPESRTAVQARLGALNPDHLRGAALAPGRLAPDGDAEVGADATGRFRVPACLPCGGILKPDVVFFGENVPRDRLAEAWRVFEGAEALLVAGSSLTVYSGRRFVLRAAREGRPVAIVNLGPTRGDEEAALKLEGRLGEALPRLADALSCGSGA